MILDLNVLLAARRADHPGHAVAAKCLHHLRQDCARGAARLTLLPVVVAGFLRLTTSRSALDDPDSMADAAAFIDDLLAWPGAELTAEPGWPAWRRKLLDSGARGNLVTDVWIAAATESLGEHLLTFDRDFRRLLAPRDFTLLPQRTLPLTPTHPPQ